MSDRRKLKTDRCIALLGTSLLLPIAFNPRFRSLARANVLVLDRLLLSIPLSHFPHVRPSLLVALPAFGALLGTADTTRCLRPRWSWYHAGVLFCLYMDLMAITLVLFLLLYPYFA